MTSIQRIDALAHLGKLRMYKMRLEQTQPADGTWDWFIDREIEELEADMKKAAH